MFDIAKEDYSFILRRWTESLGLSVTLQASCTPHCVSQNPLRFRSLMN